MKTRTQKRFHLFLTGPVVFTMLAAIMLLTLPAGAKQLPDPDGKPADMSKPVQVYILMGQSNMLGAGRVSGSNEGALENACKNKKLYPYLIDGAGNWTVRKDVRNVRVNGRTMKVYANDWMLPGGNIGPEIGIGHYLGHAVEAPVLILKSCTGNRSLGWDLLPPGSKQYEFEGRIYPGYKESPESWAKGTEPKPIGWYAGFQYDVDTRNAKAVLADLGTYYPGATEYEVAGFFWWQGDKDFRNKAHATKYEENLIALLAALRKEFNAPEAKMVIATLGQTKKDANGTQGQMINAMFNVAGESGKYPENKNKVATVYSHPLSKGGSSSGHYSGHAETYHNVGEAMGKAMVKLIQSNPKESEKGTKDGRTEGPVEQIEHQPRTWTDAKGNTIVGTFVSAARGKVVLLLDNGRKRQYTTRNFIQEDRDYVEKYSN